MMNLVSQLLPHQMKDWHTHFPPIPNASRSPDDKRKILLSGCTGFLGRNILGQLLKCKDIKEIHVLVPPGSPGSEADNIFRANLRLEAVLRDFNIIQTNNAQVILSTGFTTERWAKGSYQARANGLTDIIHAAWPTDGFQDANFFVPHICGVLYLYNIAALAKQHNPTVRFTFLSSTDAVARSPKSPIPKTISHNPADALPTGYAQSKWVAEQLLYRLSSGSRPHPQPDVRIVRIGQLTASTQDAAWKLNGRWPLMFATGVNNMGGIFPDLDALGFRRLDWLPVNFAAKAVLDIAFAKDRGDGIMEGNGLSVSHVVNCWPDGKTWKDLQEWLARPGFVHELLGKKVKIIPGHEWVKVLIAKYGERGWPAPNEDETLPPTSFTEVNQREFKPSSAGDASKKNLSIETRRTDSLSFMMKNAKHKADMSMEQLQKILRWIFNEARKLESRKRGDLEEEESELGRVLEWGYND